MSAVTIGFEASQQPPVPAGEPFAPFCIHGTVTSTTTPGVFSVLDSAGNAIKMPRAAFLVGVSVIKTVHAGSHNIKLAKNGTAISSTGGTSNALGNTSGAAQYNIWNSTTLADYSYAAGDTLGLDASGTSVDAWDVTYTFRPA